MIEQKNNKQTVAAYFIVLIGFFVILFPFLYYRENYFFTVHDYLDGWPALLAVLRRGGLFFSPDSSMPIMDGMSTCYFFLDFGAYRWLHYFFGPIWGEIANKAIGLSVGFYTARRLLIYILENFNTGKLSENFTRKSILSEEWVAILLAAAYAFTAVYPSWTISFAFLPLYFEMLLRITWGEDRLSLKRACIFLLFGFLVLFPHIGIFVFGVYCLAFLIDTIKNRRIKKDFLLYIVFMLISIIISNISIFIYVLRGDELNRSLFSTDITGDIFQFLKTLVEVGLLGQSHAAPVLFILIPLCVILYVVLLIQSFRRKDFKQITVPTIIVGIIIFFCVFYTLDNMKVISHFTSRIIPLLSGFSLERVIYFNNVLWYILFITIFKRLDKSRAVNNFLFVILVINVFVVIMCPGAYRETSANIFRERSLLTFYRKASFAEFYDTDYFESLKEDIEYDNEGVVSVGYHPAVAMFNGFNTLDGYMSVCSLDYHYKFREIIAPTLDTYPSLAEYYDAWGGRMYCFIDEVRNLAPKIEAEGEENSFLSALRIDTDARTGILYDLARVFGYSAASKDTAPETLTKDGPKDLLINADALYNLGGRYVLSKHELSNAGELGLSLVEHKTDIESSLYQVWVYKVEAER